MEPGPFYAPRVKSSDENSDSILIFRRLKDGLRFYCQDQSGSDTFAI
jgi:hypothetical protein